jgi:outer membrane protein OmpA-like peptidoglycan-associated protein
MLDPHDRSPIWPSYADLMTGLFAVMLSLFVLSYWLLQHKLDAFRISAAKYQQLQDVDEAVRSLEDEGYFTYQPEHKRHVFKQDVRFATGAAAIAPEYHDFLRAAGERVAALIERLRGRGSNTRYLLLIEGMASTDGYANNYDLSYRRALALYTLWNEMGIRFDPRICEIIIAGSGTGGAGRYTGDREHLNQRFLIQILPKIGTDILLDAAAGNQEPRRSTRPSD